MKFFDASNLFTTKVFDSPEIAAKELAKELLIKTENLINQKGNCIWSVSGGYSIIMLYDAIKNLESAYSKLWENITVCWVDERHVPHSHPKSNYGNAYRYFWSKISSVKLIPVPYFSDIKESVKAYKMTLKENNISEVDIMILGMGTDGHTASLFPGDEALKVTDNNIAFTENPDIDTSRITLTYPFINNSKLIKVFAYGEYKGSVYSAMANDPDYLKFPIVNIHKVKAEFYVDKSFFEILN